MWLVFSGHLYSSVNGVCMFIVYKVFHGPVIRAGILPWDHTHDQDICHYLQGHQRDSVCVCTGASDGTVGTTGPMTSLTRRLGVGVMNRWLIRLWAQIISDSLKDTSQAFKRETRQNLSVDSGSVFVVPLFGVKRNDIMTTYVSVGFFSGCVQK